MKEIKDLERKSEVYWESLLDLKRIQDQKVRHGILVITLVVHWSLSFDGDKK